MHNDIIEQLKTLKTIAPDEGFAQRSRTFILSAVPDQTTRRQVRFIPWLQFAGALAFAALLLLISPLLPSAQPVLSSSLDPARLANEFNGLSVNLQLQEVHYQQGTNQTVTSAMNEIVDTKTRHLNPDTLNAETPSLDPLENQTATDIEILLEEVTR
jgi:hypothetical protein